MLFCGGLVTVRERDAERLGSAAGSAWELSTILAEQLAPFIEVT